MESSLVGVSIAEQYRMQVLLDRGSHGDVYEARDASDRRVAVKVLRSELGGNPEHAARLAREAKAIGMLSHANIVTLLAAGVFADGRPYLVTELLAGVTLRELVDRERISLPRVLAITRQILEALDHAHRHGVIHRDIKPENIVIGRDDVVKVLDFGVAMLADDTRELLAETKLTQPGHSVFGSPAYIAPEVVLGHPVDARADVYSLGALLFEMLAGTTPFVDPDPVKLLRHHAFTRAPTLAEAGFQPATPELELLVGEALAKEPALRTASAAAMIANLDAARAALTPPRVLVMPFAPAQISGPAVARSSVPMSRRWPWASRRRLIAIGAAVSTCLLIGVAAAVGGTTPTNATPVGAATPTVEKTTAPAPDAQLRQHAIKVADGRDPVAAVVGLELLARLDPPAQDEIATRASVARVADVRKRARTIAERDGFRDSVDLLASYQLDLKDAMTCDDRRAAIDGLRALADRRAIGALRRAKDRFPCIAQDATDAIASLEAHP